MSVEFLLLKPPRTLMKKPPRLPIKELPEIPPWSPPKKPPRPRVAFLLQERQALSWLWRQKWPTKGRRPLSTIPPSSKYFKVGDFQFISVPGTSSVETYIREEVLDGKVVAVRSEAVEGQHDQCNEAKEHNILLAMNENFKKRQDNYNNRAERLDRREAIVAKVEACFQKRVEDAQIKCAESLQDLKDR